jgi:haloalkane dehalogenase
MEAARPGWLDPQEYPFEPHFVSVPAGRLHYVDEGSGPPIVFVHGNPAWSFEFRHQIRALSAGHRCLAMDHLGFGLSDKPEQFSYLPSAHAENLEALLEPLSLQSATLVVQDWGGPIGLAYALRHPERIRNLVISNTWMWSVSRDWRFRLFSAIMGGPIGRYRIRNSNYFVREVMRGAYGDPTRVPPQIHAQYVNALPTPASRKGSWVFPKQIIGSSAWLASLWEQRERLAGMKVLLAWGMKDFGFGEKELRRWTDLFPQATVVRFPGVGHWLAEEDPEGLTGAIRNLLAP